MNNEPFQLGKVLPFSSAKRGASRIPVTARTRWHASRPFWLTWWAIAWMLAAVRLKSAVAQREVFGFDSTLAFLVAIVLPLLAAPALLELVRSAAAFIAGFWGSRTRVQQDPTQHRRNA
jgi:hypothetical protein